MKESQTVAHNNANQKITFKGVLLVLSTFILIGVLILVEMYF